MTGGSGRRVKKLEEGGIEEKGTAEKIFLKRIFIKYPVGGAFLRVISKLLIYRGRYTRLLPLA